MPRSAGPLETGYRPRQPLGFMRESASYHWAWREVDVVTRLDTERQVLNISRSTDGMRAQPDDASIAIFLGDEQRILEPSIGLRESELREMLVAIGCEWAKDAP